MFMDYPTGSGGVRGVRGEVEDLLSVRVILVMPASLGEVDPVAEGLAKLGGAGTGEMAKEQSED